MRCAALEEHASVAAFARTICELMALGAPSWLLDATQRALGDEVAHARETFAWIERLGGGAWSPGPLIEATAEFRGDGAAGLFRDVFRGGAVGETLAAARADEAASHDALSDDLRAFYTRIAEDEARHAALAFETLSWVLVTFPELHAIRDEEVLRFRSEAAADARALVEPLLDLLQ
jgi:hypothetical protein